MIISEYQKIVPAVPNDERNINMLIETGVPVFVFNPLTTDFKRLPIKAWVEWSGYKEYRLFTNKDANKYTMVYPHNLFICRNELEGL